MIKIILVKIHKITNQLIKTNEILTKQIGHYR